MTDLETRALRDARIRKHDAIVVFLFVAPTLNAESPKAVKVRSTATGLDMKRRRVRDALRLLVTLGYLVQAEVAGTGTAGTYLLPPTGARTAPVQRLAD